MLGYAGATRQEWRHRCSVSFKNSWGATAAVERMTARAGRAVCWAASSAVVVAGAAPTTAMTTAVGMTTMTTDAGMRTITTGAGMAVDAGGGAMTTMTMIRSSSPLRKDCQKMPVVPYHDRCQGCLVRLATKRPER